ncbi:AraC family ligand binding domain-containing protein [Streptomyces venezuelae]|uniref:AraC family ligand binding domain-containing protein n=1 Tax=Streptomyces venezuelae TaxID=54571 RepID=UPI003454FFB7
MSQPGAPAPLLLGPQQTGAPGRGPVSLVWSLHEPGRDLDAAVVRLAPGTDLGEDAGAGHGLLLTVLAGDGELRLADTRFPLAPGALAWLPAHTAHALRAGAQGLTYTTAHRRPAPAGPGTGAGEPVCLLDRVCPQCGRLAAGREDRFCARCGQPLTGTGDTAGTGETAGSG